MNIPTMQEICKSPEILALKKRNIVKERIKFGFIILLVCVSLFGWCCDVNFILWWIPASCAMALAVDLIAFQLSGGWTKWFEVSR